MSSAPYVKTAIAGLLVGLFAAVGLMMESSPTDPNSELVNATVFHGQTRAMPGFSLIGHDEQPFTRDALEGHWSVVFVGYTNCPDICPVTMTSLRGMVRGMPAELRDEVRVVMVSVDPERDTPDHLKRYVTYFDQGFLGVTGTTAELNKFTRGISAVYQVEEHEPGATDYQVGHSSHLAIINPLGRFHGILSAPHESDQMIADLTHVIEAYGG